MKTLHLTLKKKWFDMILSGEKKEEYREIKPYWKKRLCNGGNYIKYDMITFKNGYSKNAPIMEVECRGIEIGITESHWCDDGEIEVFIIKLGKVIFFKNV